MSWNECLYQYHKKNGGQFLAGEKDDGLLLLTWKDRPLAVDLHEENGRYEAFYHVQARIAVTLGTPYKLTIGPEKKLSGGVNAVLRAVPGLPENKLLPADFGFPEVTKKRLIRTGNAPFTKLVLGSLELRNALLACPQERVVLRPGPGEEGLHLIAVTTDAALNSLSGDSGWYLADDFDWTAAGSGEEEARRARQAEEEFFSRMDRFLDLTRAVYDAVTRWPMPEPPAAGSNPGGIDRGRRL